MTAPQIDPDEVDPTGELSAYIAAQTREWGTYVVTEKIYFGNALAANPGDPMPISNVVKYGYFRKGKVALIEGAEHAPEVLATLDEADRPATSLVEQLAAEGAGITAEEWQIVLAARAAKAAQPAPDAVQPTNEELREELRDRGLPVSGNKDELVERLRADDSPEPAPGLTIDRAEPGGAPPIDEEERI
jgi:hypothetical protein